MPFRERVFLFFFTSNLTPFCFCLRVRLYVFFRCVRNYCISLSLSSPTVYLAFFCLEWKPPQGRFEFQGLLRVEGRFEGVLRPAGSPNVIVARSGVVIGDIEGCNSVVVEGTVVGNVSAAVVDLRRNAHVEG